MDYKFSDLNTMTLGSAPWVAAVYASGPARKVGGRSRPTQRYFAAANQGNCEGELEGRNESIAHMLLCVLRNSGIVSRFKHQPFRLSQEIHGVEAFPDFMFDLVDGRRFVLEVKANRFIDTDVRKHLEAVNSAFADTNITYLLWTDKWPLHRPVINSMRHMRRANQQGYPLDQLQTVRDEVQFGPKTLKELRNCAQAGHFDLVLSAAYSGMVFFNFFKEIDDYTIVSKEMDGRILEMLLQTKVQGTNGWDAGTPG